MRQLLTVDEVINCVVSDDEDYDDPDEPMMEGSDDDFSDLELDDNMDDGDTFEQICPSCSASNSSPTLQHSPPTSPSPSISTQSSPSSQSTSGTCFYCYNITRLILCLHVISRLRYSPHRVDRTTEACDCQTVHRSCRPHCEYSSVTTGGL